MLKGSMKNSYRTTDGRKMYVYLVTGTAKELEKFKEVQSTYYRTTDGTDAGTPLYFVSATTPDGNVNPNIDKVINLSITEGLTPRVVIDSTQAEIQALQEAKRLVPQELAKQMATSMFGGARGGATFVRTAADNQQPVNKDDIPAPAEDKTVEELEAANKAAAEGTETLS